MAYSSRNRTRNRFQSQALEKHTGAYDRDHGGWVDISAPWNYWQIGSNSPAGSNNVVYACVQAYAQTIAQLPARHQRERSDGGTDIIKTSAAHRVMRKPNHYQSASDFKLNLVCGLLLDGNAYGLVTRNNRSEVDAIHLISPGSCSVTTLPDGDIYYHVSPEAASGVGPMLVPQRDILHVKLYTPYDPLRGETPLQAVAWSIATNNAIQQNQSSFFTNMTRPSGVLTTDEKLKADQIEDLRNRWEEHSKGLNSGKVPILSWGIKWQALSMSAADAQMIESLKFSVRDIARAYRVPLPLIGEEEASTYNNVYNLMSFWKASGLGFVLEHVEEALTNLFRLDDGDKINFDTDQLLRTDMAARIDALTKGITGGVFSPNEARRKEGLPDVEGGEMPRVQQQMVPLDYEEPEPVAPALPAPVEPAVEDDDEEDIEERSIIARELIRQAMA